MRTQPAQRHLKLSFASDWESSLRRWRELKGTALTGSFNSADRRANWIRKSTSLSKSGYILKMTFANCAERGFQGFENNEKQIGLYTWRRDRARRGSIDQGVGDDVS